MWCPFFYRSIKKSKGEQKREQGKNRLPCSSSLIPCPVFPFPLFICLFSPSFFESMNDTIGIGILSNTITFFPFFSLRANQFSFYSHSSTYICIYLYALTLKSKVLTLSFTFFFFLLSTISSSSAYLTDCNCMYWLSVLIWSIHIYKCGLTLKLYHFSTFNYTFGGKRGTLAIRVATTKPEETKVKVPQIFRKKTVKRKEIRLFNPVLS